MEKSERKVKAIVDLALGPFRKVKRGRVGKIVLEYASEKEGSKTKFWMVQFGPRTRGIWPDNCFEVVEDE